MFMGVGIIGALASILSSILVGAPASAAEEEEEAAAPEIPVEMLAPATKQDVVDLRNELSALRKLLEKTPTDHE